MTGGLRQLFYPAVVKKTVAIENHLLDPPFQGLLGHEVTDDFGSLGVAGDL